MKLRNLKTWRIAGGIGDSEFKPLHEINPLRLDYIDQNSGGLKGKKVIDVGCGGGILAESMALRGADTLGIDMGEAPLSVAELDRCFGVGCREYFISKNHC